MKPTTKMASQPLPGVEADGWLPYVLLHTLTGFNFFGHGFARIFTGTYLQGFAQGMAKSMVATPLPTGLVLGTGYVVPVVELAIGVLLLTGFWVRPALVTAFFLLFVLMFGITLKQDWNVAGQQLEYGLILGVLLFFQRRYDRSWFQVLRQTRSGSGLWR